MPDAPGPARPRITYDGRPGELFSLWLVNLLLTAVTLGVYRFWARARTRRYLWSHLAVDGHRFAYTGTGGELFRGFLLALLGVLVPALLVVLAAPLVLPEPLVPLAILAVYAALLPLGLFGVFTARRYLMRRTVLRGIAFEQGGSAWDYAFRMTGRLLLTAVTLGLHGPWMIAASLRRTVGATRHGGTEFRFDGEGGELLGWALLCGVLGATVMGLALLLAMPTLVQAGAMLGGASPGEGLGAGSPFRADPDRLAFLLLGAGAPLLAGYLVAIALGAVVWQAVTWRFLVEHTLVGNAGTGAARLDLATGLGGIMGSIASNALIVVLSLGLLTPIAQHRWMRFATRTLVLDGRLDLDRAVPRQVPRGPGHGEGLADAFGVGAAAL
ncbi:YjgN family protein [Roseomonas sp. NAR14]|uniref:YjgN family protein n=1 Tax=Roseomonas acroporae TaxID=2937791 RepID=A0A9X1YB39_9PROT|nr:DUF898 family protein [Roseomonas acroporae]MCK8783271.1 YjgN family protein [Roseomonas acroporae]